MRILIIHAHPEANSFCSALHQTAHEHFINQGHEVKVSDLYRMGFNPVGNEADFKELSHPEYFKYQAEQMNACEKDLFVIELKTEMNKLEWCDVLIFNFPLWWFGLPAILKGWVDRVFAMGLVYGNGRGVYENGIYKDKIAFVTLTTGGPEIAYNGGKNGNIMDILYPINHGMFYFAGMQVKTPFISYSPVRKTDEERFAELDRFKNYLDRIQYEPSLY